MSDRSFDDLLREYRTRGAIALAKDTPVLIRYGGGSEDKGQEERAYRTAFGRVEDTSPTNLEQTGQLRVLGAVIPVLKKEGAPFPDQIGVGRASNTDVCLPLTSISKYHAFFCLDGAGYTVSDAGSKNGTWLDGQRLSARNAVPIVDGARLRLGPYKFLFYSYHGFLDLLEQRADL
jgi:hypothetical protein